MLTPRRYIESTPKHILWFERPLKHIFVTPPKDAWKMSRGDISDPKMSLGYILRATIAPLDTFLVLKMYLRDIFASRMSSQDILWASSTGAQECLENVPRAPPRGSKCVEPLPRMFETFILHFKHILPESAKHILIRANNFSGLLHPVQRAAARQV